MSLSRVALSFGAFGVLIAGVLFGGAYVNLLPPYGLVFFLWPSWELLAGFMTIPNPSVMQIACRVALAIVTNGLFFAAVGVAGALGLKVNLIMAAATAILAYATGLSLWWYLAH